MGVQKEEMSESENVEEHEEKWSGEV